MNYDVNYFIKKFEAIPEGLWCIGEYGETNTHCALGHCGVNKSISSLSYGTEGDALFSHMLKLSCGVTGINDGQDPRYQQPTPKQRILAALYDIKKMQQPVHEDITKELAVLPVAETSDTLLTNSLA